MAKKEDPFNFTMPKLPTIPGIKAPKGWGQSRLGIKKREPFGNLNNWLQKNYPFGTQPEYALYRALLSLGLKDGIDFLFKPPQLPFATVVFPNTHSVLIIQDGVSESNKLNQIATLHQLGLSAVYVPTVTILSDPTTTVKNAISGSTPSL